MKITSNMLKVIAIICMIIDHIGYYFYYNIDYNTYIVLREIGRIAMPIFSFLVVEGFLHTKSKKKYFSRLLFTAIITQFMIIFLKHVNLTWFKNYSTNIYNIYNIVFSFSISIIILSIIEYKINSKFNLDKILKLISIIFILFIYKFVNIDYSFYVPILVLVIYVIKRTLKDEKYLILKNILISISIFIICIINQKLIGIFSVLALPFICLYNSKLGKKSKLLQYTFYFIFPLQHCILYSIAMVLCYKNIT